MDDLISRSAAIRSVCEKECRVLKPCNAECGSITALRELPSAERRGRWVDLKCDQCGQVDVSKPNYCPNCGARMMDEVKE